MCVCVCLCVCVNDESVCVCVCCWTCTAGHAKTWANLLNALCGTSISHPQHYSTGGGHAPPPPPLCLHQHHTFLSYSQVATVQYIHDVATPCVLVLTKHTFITQVSLYYLNIHSLATKCILCWFILISVFHFHFSIHWFIDNWSGTQCAVCSVQCGQ